MIYVLAGRVSPVFAKPFNDIKCATLSAAHSYVGARPSTKQPAFYNVVSVVGTLINNLYVDGQGC